MVRRAVEVAGAATPLALVAAWNIAAPTWLGGFLLGGLAVLYAAAVSRYIRVRQLANKEAVELRLLDDYLKCPTCFGRGEVYAEAPWARWLDCADCRGTGRPADP